MNYGIHLQYTHMYMYVYVVTTDCRHLSTHYVYGSVFCITPNELQPLNLKSHVPDPS